MQPSISATRPAGDYVIAIVVNILLVRYWRISQRVVLVRAYPVFFSAVCTQLHRSSFLGSWKRTSLYPLCTASLTVFCTCAHPALPPFCIFCTLCFSVLVFAVTTGTCFFSAFTCCATTFFFPDDQFGAPEGPPKKHPAKSRNICSNLS